MELTIGSWIPPLVARTSRNTHGIHALFGHVQIPHRQHKLCILFRWGSVPRGSNHHLHKRGQTLVQKWLELVIPMMLPGRLHDHWLKVYLSTSEMGSQSLRLIRKFIELLILRHAGLLGASGGMPQTLLFAGLLANLLQWGIEVHRAQQSLIRVVQVAVGSCVSHLLAPMPQKNLIVVI